MLRDALKTIGSGQVTGVDDLASRLGVTAALADQLVADLVRLGYLATPDAACASGCRGCPIADQCGGSPRIFLLTERGRRAAAAGP